MCIADVFLRRVLAFSRLTHLFRTSAELTHHGGWMEAFDDKGLTFVRCAINISYVAFASFYELYTCASYWRLRLSLFDRFLDRLWRYRLFDFRLQSGGLLCVLKARRQAFSFWDIKLNMTMWVLTMSFVRSLRVFHSTLWCQKWSVCRSSLQQRFLT